MRVFETRTPSGEPVNIDLGEREQATLIASQLPRSPRLEAARSILTKLGIDAAGLPSPSAD